MGTLGVDALLRTNNSLLTLVNVNTSSFNVSVTILTVAVEGAFSVNTLSSWTHVFSCITFVKVFAGTFIPIKTIITNTAETLTLRFTDSMSADTLSTHINTFSVNGSPPSRAVKNTCVTNKNVGGFTDNYAFTSLACVSFLAGVNTIALNNLLTLFAVLYTLPAPEDVVVRAGCAAGVGADGVGTLPFGITSIEEKKCRATERRDPNFS